MRRILMGFCGANSYERSDKDAIIIELKKEVATLTEMNKMVSNTVAVTCNQYKGLLSQFNEVSTKMEAYKTELDVVQIQLIKYMDDNNKLKKQIDDAKSEQLNKDINQDIYNESCRPDDI